MEIHIVRGEDQSGPYTVEQVQDYLAQGILLPDDLAWYDGLTDWIPLSQVMDSVGAPAASPPPEPVAATPDPTEPEPSTVEDFEESPAKAGGNKKLLIGIGAGVAVLAIAAAVWFFFIREKDAGTGNQQVAQQSQSTPSNNAPAPVPPKPNPNEPTNSPPPPVLPPVTNTPISPKPNPQPGTNVLPPLPPATNLPPLPPTTNALPLPPTTNAPTPVDPGPDKPIKKLTAKEAAEVMAFDIGQWETKGKGMLAGDEPYDIEMTMEASWKEEGKSVEYKFTVMEDGKSVNYFGHMEYDEAKGIFIYRTKWEEDPESTSHARYDPETQTSHAQSAPTQPPSESTSITVTKRMGKDKTQQTLRVLQHGQLVYSHEITSTRKAEKPATTKPAPPLPPTTNAPPLPPVTKIVPNSPKAKAAIEAAIRKAAKKPTGELTKADYVKVTELGALEGLSNNQLTEVPNGLEKLTQLTRLNLSYNKLTDVKGLEKLTRLEELQLGNNKLTDVKGLEKLTELKRLDLRVNPDLTEAQIAELQKALPKCKIYSNPAK